MLVSLMLRARATRSTFENDGQLEGHDAAFATEHGISYFVSIHGHTHDDGDVAMLLAILAQAD